MRQHLLVLLIATVIVSSPLGCARRQPEPTLGPVPGNAFIKAWGANLDLSRDPVERLFLRDDILILYTRGHRVYTFSSAGGQLLWTSAVTASGSELRTPIILGDKIVFPTISTMEVYDRRGRKISSVELDRATRGPGVAKGNSIYIGLDYGTGGRLAKLEITRPHGRTVWELMTFGGITAQPTWYEDIIYAASNDGRLYAVADNRDPVWPIDGNTFLTAGPIVADVKADDFGVYVASTDSKLYCLDRLTGRIKWSYYAGVPLRTAPVVVGNRVYQYVPRRGLVAIDKTTGSTSREPVWFQPAVRRFLSTDDRYVYALGADNSVVALDRADGQPRFRSRRRDLDITTENTRDATIFAATTRGEVLAIRPVLTPGTVGQIVFQEKLMSQPVVIASDLRR